MGKLLETSLLSHLPSLPWPTHHDNIPIHEPEEDQQQQQQLLHRWEAVAGLCESQRRALNSLSSHGVLWKHPSKPTSQLFHLFHGGDVGADGNCLFSAANRTLGLKGSPADLRRRVVKRFVADYGAKSFPREETDLAIRNLYRPDLELGWGVHFIQEVKVLALKKDRSMLDSSIDDLVRGGLSREAAAERVYKEKCLKVDNGEAWVKYMSISGDVARDEYDIVSLHYTEEGLLSVEENRAGKAAAFGDDVAIEALATEFQREVYVVQVHGSDDDASDAEGGALFFLPHKPRGQILGSPVFLLMKGTDWCGAGADHYEPLISRVAPVASKEKPVVIL